MDFDQSKKVEKPAEVVEGSVIEFARRGSKLVFAATKDGKVQIQKVWTGPHSKQETYEFLPTEVNKEQLDSQLKSEGYKLRPKE